MRVLLESFRVTVRFLIVILVSTWRLRVKVISLKTRGFLIKPSHSVFPSIYNSPFLSLLSPHLPFSLALCISNLFGFSFWLITRFLFLASLYFSPIYTQSKSFSLWFAKKRKWRKVWATLFTSNLWTTSPLCVDQLRNPWTFIRIFLGLFQSGDLDHLTLMGHGNYYQKEIKLFFLSSLICLMKFPRNLGLIFQYIIWVGYDAGCLDTGLEYISCNRRIQRVCLRKRKSIPRIITFLSRLFHFFSFGHIILFLLPLIQYL